MRRPTVRERGSYILEVAGVVVGIVVLILGTGDILRLTQARSAVRAAVQDGIRCLYPTDGGCASMVPGALSSLNKRFNVFVWGSGYKVPQESFVATSQWRTQPVYRAPLENGPISSIQVDINPLQYEEREIVYPLTGHVPYIVQTTQLPHVSGGQPLDPLFIDPITRATPQPMKTLSLSRIRGVTSVGPSSPTTEGFEERFKIGSVSFSVADAWASYRQDLQTIAALEARGSSPVQCFSGPVIRDAQGVRVAWGGGSPQRCSYRAGSEAVWGGRKAAVPLMFRISGATSGTSRDGEGKALVSLTWRNAQGSVTKNLGGRVINRGASGNFIPRGLGWGEIRDSLEWTYSSYAQEIELYNTLPLIPIDATVTLDFYLVSTNKRPVTWLGDAVEVFYPRYQFVHDQYDCGYSNDPRVCSSVAQSVPVSLVELRSGAPLKVAALSGRSCAEDTLPNAEESAESAIARVESGLREGQAARPYRFMQRVATDNAKCPVRQLSFDCPSRPVAPYLRGCGEGLDARAVVDQCVGAGAVPQLVGLRAINHAPASARDYRMFKGCSGEMVPECADSFKEKSGDELWFPNEGQEDACSASSIQRPPQMIVGPLPQDTCSDSIASVTKLFRKQHAVPNEATVSVVRLPAPPLYSASPPSGACTPYMSAEGDTQEMVCGTSVTARAAERCCAVSAGRCRTQEVELGTSGSDRSLTLALDVASRRVVDGVQAGYPAARHASQCAEGDVECIRVLADLSPDRSSATLSASMDVPLYLLGLADKRRSTVEHSVTRALESAVINR